jgi:catecholate siderophore receptor
VTKSTICTLLGLCLWGASASAQIAPTLRFDIPDGGLATAIARFEAAAHVTVVVPDGVPVEALTSPGVSGVYTVEQALSQLLSGTMIGFRAGAPGIYSLEVRVSPTAVEVTAAPGPYKAETSSTATRTPTPLRDVPQTLLVVPRALLVDQNAQSVAEAVKSVPGVTVAQGEGNRDQLVLRGFSSPSDFFVNGVRDDQERFRDLYNVESLEVLQGPAAVLFGRGGAGGIVNLVTRQPVRGAASTVAFSLGSFDRKRATAQVGRSIGSRATMLVSAVGESSGGFRESFYLRRYGINPTVAVDVGRATTLTFSGEFLSDRRLADRGIPSQDGRPVAVPATQLFGSSSQNEARSGVNSATATVEHGFSGGLRLRNHFLAGRYGKVYRNVYAGSAVGAAGTFTLSAYDHDNNRTNVFNQTDVTYGAATGPLNHSLVAGAEISRQFQDETRHTAANIPGVPVAASDRDANFDAAPLAFDRRATSTGLATYVQDQIAVSRRWKAVLGLRVDRFSVAVDNHLPGVGDLSRSDLATSPRAGVIYQPNATASLYGSYTYTFLPSGQTLGLAPTTVDLEPEDARNYEAGAKLDLLRQRLNLSAAVFRLDRNHVRSTDPLDSTRFVQTGQQRTGGVTLSAAGSLLPQWKVSAGYAWLNARITQATSSAPAGRTVGLVPTHQIAVWTTYDVSTRWGGGGGVTSQSRTYTSFSNEVVLPAFFRLDAVVYHRLRGYRLAVNADNVLNARYYATANGDNNISPAAPRSIQLSLSTTF